MKNPSCEGKNRKTNLKDINGDYSGCQHKFLDKKHLKTHKNECHGEKLTCPHCSTHIKSKKNYVRHLRECTKKAKVYECDKCDYVTPWKGNIWIHKIMQHTKKKVSQTENMTVRPCPETFVRDALDGSVMVIGSGVNIHVYSKDKKLCSRLKRLEVRD